MRGDPRPSTTITQTIGMFDHVAEDLCPGDECLICWVFSDPTPAVRAKIAALLTAAPERRGRPPKEPRPPAQPQRVPGQPRPREWIDRAPLLALLSTDRWTSSDELAASVGLTASGIRTVIMRAQRRGAPIEGRRNCGYRIKAS